MRTLDLSTRLLSEAVWSKIQENAALRLEPRRAGLLTTLADLNSLRQQADYDTGSIGTASAWLLYALSYYFGPATLAEVGTFIGRSAVSLSLGAEDAGTGRELHTCDLSNAIEIPSFSKCRIVQYPRKSSTAMFDEMGANGVSDIEMLHLDGGLQGDDIRLATRLCAADVIVALDDFEGIEKGVANLFNIRNAGWLPTHLLVYPCSDALIQRFGFHDHSTIALLVPQSTLRITAQ